MAIMFNILNLYMLVRIMVINLKEWPMLMFHLLYSNPFWIKKGFTYLVPKSLESNPHALVSLNSTIPPITII
jgi:hypothetical protein